MKPVVLIASSNSSTVNQLVNLLREAGADAYCGMPDRPLDNPVVVHWGSGVDKRNELAVLHRAGVPAPQYSRVPVTGWIPRRRNHREARDFTNPPAMPDFWTEPVFTNHEFRVHVIHGQAFRTQYKYLPEGTEALVRYGVPVRNHSLGWKFTPRVRARFPDRQVSLVQDAGLAAVRALGYDLGAADVGLIVGSNGLVPDRAVVFEVNTKPSMDEYTQAAYVEALLGMARR